MSPVILSVVANMRSLFYQVIEITTNNSIAQKILFGSQVMHHTLSFVDMLLVDCLILLCDTTTATAAAAMMIL